MNTFQISPDFQSNFDADCISQVGSFEHFTPLKGEVTDFGDFSDSFGGNRNFDILNPDDFLMKPEQIVQIEKLDALFAVSEIHDTSAWDKSLEPMSSRLQGDFYIESPMSPAIFSSVGSTTHDESASQHSNYCKKASRKTKPKSIKKLLKEEERLICKSKGRKTAR